MKRRLVIALVALLVAVGVIAGVALAQLTDIQTASGTVTATSGAADLYICEPDPTTLDPACGSDDSGADEVVFESLENLRPGDVAEWDIRLKNVGSTTLRISAATLGITETADPGNDCPGGALLSSPMAYYDDHTFFSSTAGVWILGKLTDPNSWNYQNDNPTPSLPGFPVFRTHATPPTSFTIEIAAGDYEDVRLHLNMLGSGTENCDGNEWNVTWTFEAS